MKKRVRFTSIRQKLILSFFIMVMFVVILGIYNFLMTKSTNESVESIANEDLPLVMVTNGLVTSLGDRIAVAYGYVLFGEESYKDRFEEFTEQGLEFERQIRELHSSAAFDDLMNRVVEWGQFISSEVFDVYDSGNATLAQQRLQQSAGDVQALMDEYKAMVEASQNSIMQKENEVISNGNNVMLIGVAVTIFVVIISIVISFVTANMIAKPIKTVMERMRSIASGDLSLEPLHTKANDETGQLILVTNEMNEGMRDLLQKIHIVSETVSTQSEELTQSSGEVMAGTEQISLTMQDLATAAESQANHSTELSSAMHSFTLMIEEANQNGDHIHESTQQVLDMTTKGTELMEASTIQMEKIDQIVQDVVKKVDLLDENSKEISKLVLVIQEIADQTNLLALNAAIEAARAGEHGKGFAVVADEVRKLAEQVSVSVTDITNIVERNHNESSAVTTSLQSGYTEVQAGSSKIATTGETFTEISRAVSDMIERVNKVTQNLNDITANSQEMNVSIEEVAAISEEAAAGVEETSANSEQSNAAMEEVTASTADLAKLAEKLNDLLNQFKL
ncbi:methyl-accepting chemotaxis protein [Oceanobacillus sp. CAU 1775]